MAAFDKLRHLRRETTKINRLIEEEFEQIEVEDRLDLDMNGLSAVAEGESALEPIHRKAAQTAIPVIVLAEYRYWISQSRNRKRYERWLAEYLPTFRILDVAERTALSCRAVRTELKKAGKPIPSKDVWIAAFCRQHSLPLLSRDRHFDAATVIQKLEW